MSEAQPAGPAPTPVPEVHPVWEELEADGPPALECGIDLVHVGLVMLVVVDAHRLLVDVRLERVVVVGERRNFESHLQLLSVA